jgi:hypothetical protein
MTNRRVLMALAVVCLVCETLGPGLWAQTLGEAAAAAAARRQAAQDQQASRPAGEKRAAEPQKAAPEPQKSQVPPEKPAGETGQPRPRKVFTEADLPGHRPEDLARAAEVRKLDGRYDALLARLQALNVKMKEDVRAAKGAEFDLKVFKLDMANRNKVEKRQALERRLAEKKSVVQQNLVVLEQLRGEQRVLDAELARLQEGR